MAAFIVAAIFQGTISIHNLVQDRRSPLLPTPPSENSASHHITERNLKRTLREWEHRLMVLEAKVRGLKLAKSKGLDACWAGPVRSLRTIRKAREESRWVTERLRRALDWCRAQDVQKGGYGLITKSRSSPKRPSHTATPPALFELPYPLPIALPPSDYKLTVVRPQIECPPLYSSELLEGEKALCRTAIERTDSLESLESDEE